MSSLLTLLFNDPPTLFRPGAGVWEYPMCQGIAKIGLFCALGHNYTELEIARWIAVAILAVVAAGWRPCITGLLHWWVSFSIWTSALVTDGGDQAAAVLTLLLLPLTLTDPRRWHWQRHESADGGRSAFAKLVTLSSLLAARVQVAGIYFHAAIAKTFVPEWADGTAVYYYLTDPMMGLPAWQQHLWLPILQSPLVVIPTWGTIVLELFLVFALFLPDSVKRIAFALGVAFHALIAIMIGLISFATVMMGALIIFLRPESKSIESLLWRVNARLQPRPIRRATIPESLTATQPLSRAN